MVTFQVKVSRFQMKPTRSSSTRRPALGARGRIRLAGVSISVDRQAHSAAPVVHTTAASTQKKYRSVWGLNSRGGIAYMMLKALAMTSGIRVHPKARPRTPPTRLAEKA